MDTLRSHFVDAMVRLTYGFLAKKPLFLRSAALRWAPKLPGTARSPMSPPTPRRSLSRPPPPPPQDFSPRFILPAH
ncbi:unnamed protein product [Penicillium salamii]|nr:unnamed protein product [Penicillium salamii]